MRTLSNRVNTVLLILVVLMLASVLARRTFGGPLDPPAAPASTGKIQILSLPYTITDRGSYVLNQNLTGAGGSSGIYVAADDVTVDLNGFALNGPGGASGESAIFNQGPSRNNVTVRNGVVRGWNGYGIYLPGRGIRIEDVVIDFVGLSGGMAAVVGTSSVITGIDVNGGLNGLSVSYSEVSDCNIHGTTMVGIASNSSDIHHCNVTNNARGIELYGGSQLRDSVVANNGGDGVLVTGKNNFIAGNLLFGNGSPGGWAAIHIGSPHSANRVEGNNFGENVLSIRVDAPGNVIVKNTVRGGAPMYSIAAGNTVGDNTNIAGVEPTSPWANVNY